MQFREKVKEALGCEVDISMITSFLTLVNLNLACFISVFASIMNALISDRVNMLCLLAKTCGI